MIASPRILVVGGCVLAVLLQVLLAPYLGIGAVVPNFILVFVMQLAVVRSRAFGCVLPFVMGLVYDLVSGMALGPMAFSLTLFAVLVGRAFSLLDNDTLFMPLVMMVGGILLVDLSYGLFMLFLGYDAGLFEAFVYRIGPCFIYDAIVALITYPLARRLLALQPQARTDVIQLR